MLFFKKIIFTFFTLVLFISALALEVETNKYILIGKLINSFDSSVVTDAHIININSNKGTISNNKGIFKIPVNKNDTLVFSSIGFEYTVFTVCDSILNKADTIEINLLPRCYELPSVKIFPYMNYEDFKQAFLNMEIKDETIDLHLPDLTGFGKPVPKSEFGLAVSSPITFFYNQFSKEGKELRKYAEIIKRDNYQKHIIIKYNKEIISLITGLKDDEEIMEFIEFCDFSDEFIKQSIDYDIYLAIKNCYRDFILRN
ncbi:MAG: hypothetical protein KAT68_05900 [Bacteroidales bacterium]|nr:hypothetical protein [Bacteroidales bacterium]